MFNKINNLNTTTKYLLEKQQLTIIMWDNNLKHFMPKGGEIKSYFEE